MKVSIVYCFADHRAISGCEPSWYKAGKSCYLLSLPSAVQWSNARTSCHRLGAELAVVSDGGSLQALAWLRRENKLEDQDLFVGLSGSKLRWLWLDGENVSDTDDLWGPYKPSGDGKCGSFLNARGSSKWDGYGWRWNDLPCATNIGYICEHSLGRSRDQFLIVIYAGLRLDNRSVVIISKQTATIHLKNSLFLAVSLF